MKLLKIRELSLALTLGMAALVSQAAPVTITFNEAGGPTGSLTGSTFYQSFGIASFTDAIQFGPDTRLPDDGYGITNGGPSASILFSESMSAVSLTWAVAGAGVNFVAELYDASNMLIDSFSSGGVGLFGVASFTDTGVRKITFHDGGAQVAIDTLNYTRGAAVPEPASLALVGLALAGLAAARRRKA